MRKLNLIVIAALAAAVFAGCVTTTGGSSGVSNDGSGSRGGSPSGPAKSLGGVPDFVNQAYMNASEDVLVGIGTFKIGNDASKISVGKTVAETRARADITRQLQAIMKDMGLDFQAVSELDPDASASFQLNMTEALAKSDLRGSKTVKMDTLDGVLWVVMEYSKSAAVTDFDAASSAAKLKTPAAMAFSALDFMDKRFEKEAGGGPVPLEE